MEYLVFGMVILYLSFFYITAAKLNSIEERKARKKHSYDAQQGVGGQNPA